MLGVSFNIREVRIILNKRTSECVGNLVAQLSFSITFGSSDLNLTESF